MNIVNWVLAHQAFVAGIAVAVVDLVWAIVPSLKSNGILHSVYDFVKNRVAPAA